VAQSSLAIRKINAEYLISTEHPEPFALRDRLDSVVRRSVSSALSSVLGSGIDTSDDGLLFIRSLTIDVNLNAEWDDYRMAEVWAQAIALAIARVLPGKARDDMTAWFATREEYLADYLRQTAAGTASNRWYFTPFEGLRLLPASAAILTALSRDPVEGLAALHEMSPADLLATTRALTRADILRSMGILFSTGAPYSDAQARTAALTWSRLTPHHAATSDDEPRLALQLCVEITRLQSRFAGHALTEAALGLARLERLLQSDTVGSTALLRQALKEGDVASLYRAVGAGDAELIAPLCRWPNDLRTELAGINRYSSGAETSQGRTRHREEFSQDGAKAEPGSETDRADPSVVHFTSASATPAEADSARQTDVQSDRTGSDSSQGIAHRQLPNSEMHSNPQSAVHSDPMETRFGGIFLLLPVLDEILPAAALSSWPDCSNDSAAALLRLLIISRCLGYDRATGAQSDPLMRMLVGAPGSRPNEIDAWVSGISKGRWLQITREISSRIRPLPLPHNPSILIGTVTSRGGQTAIAIESSRGCWLFAAGYQARRPGAAIERILNLARELEPNAIVVQDEGLAKGLLSAEPDNRIHWISEPQVEAICAEDAGLNELLARVGHMKDDYDYLGVRQTAPEADRALRVAAQNVLRVFAARLPGFAHSSLPYLRQNFLSFGATMEFEASGRSIVRLSRPPLHLILNMTGMNRATYRLSWLEQWQFALFPEA
jgi:hypothetical protein